MIIKKGVEIDGLKDDIKKVFPIVEEICGIYGIVFVITAGTDGKHMRGSRHYIGLAIDVRTRDLHHLDIDEFASSVRGRLEDEYPEEFDLVLHSTHLHIEYDPK